MTQGSTGSKWLNKSRGVGRTTEAAGAKQAVVYKNKGDTAATATDYAAQKRVRQPAVLNNGDPVVRLIRRSPAPRSSSSHECTRRRASEKARTRLRWCFCIPVAQNSLMPTGDATHSAGTGMVSVDQSIFSKLFGGLIQRNDHTSCVHQQMHLTARRLRHTTRFRCSRVGGVVRNERKLVYVPDCS